MKHISQLLNQVEQAVYENKVVMNPALEYTDNQRKYISWLIDRVKEIDKESLIPENNIITPRQITLDLTRKRMLCYILNYEVVIDTLDIKKKHRHANYYDILDIKDIDGNTVKLQKHDNLYLSGEVGNGKTHTGIAILLQCFFQGLSVKYIKECNIIDKLRSLDNYQRYRITEEIKKYDMLLIDDFGSEPSETAYTTKFKYGVYDYRHDEELKTITTGNHNFDNLKNIIISDNPTMFERVISRMSGLHNRKIELAGHDRRII